MPFAITNQSTLSDIVNEVAAEVGYGPNPDPAGSSDPSMQKFIRAANAGAAQLFTMHNWEFLKKQGKVTVAATVPGAPEEGFALPPDYGRWVNQTQNDATMRQPAYGPVTDAIWNAIQFLQPQVTFNLFWQVRGGQLVVLAPPAPPGHDITFLYMSLGYVVDADDPALLKNVASKNGDKYLFDYYLLQRITKVKWLEQNGFNSDAALRDFFAAFAARTAQPEGAPVLSMAGSGFQWMRYLNVANIPQSGMGM